MMYRRAFVKIAALPLAILPHTTSASRSSVFPSDSTPEPSTGSSSFSTSGASTDVSKHKTPTPPGKAGSGIVEELEPRPDYEFWKKPSMRKINQHSGTIEMTMLGDGGYNSPSESSLSRSRSQTSSSRASRFMKRAVPQRAQPKRKRRTCKPKKKSHPEDGIELPKLRFIDQNIEILIRVLEGEECPADGIPAELSTSENLVFATSAFQNLTLEDKEGMIQRFGGHKFQHKDNVEAVRKLMAEKLIPKEVQKRLLVQENKVWKWNFPYILRARKIHIDYFHSHGTQWMEYKLALWENDYVLSIDSETLKHWSGLAEEQKRELYEYCRTGILSVENNKHIVDQYKIDWDTLRAEAAKLLRGGEVPEYGQDEDLESDVWKRLCWEESTEQVKVMQLEKIMDKDLAKAFGRTLHYLGIGTSSWEPFPKNHVRNSKHRESRPDTSTGRTKPGRSTGTYNEDAGCDCDDCIVM